MNGAGLEESGRATTFSYELSQNPARTSSWTLDQIASLAPRLGITDARCPFCAPQVSARGARRPVFRIWRERYDFVTFACARCGEKGWAKSGPAAASSPARLLQMRGEAVERKAAERANSLRKARWLWSASVPIAPSSPPFVYLREARGYHGTIPSTLRYLRPRKAGHHHAMIAAVGVASEVEQDAYTITDETLVAVHLTLLQPDGSGKAEVHSDKLIIGQGSAGFPIYLAPPNDLLGLAITEGIEDGLSMHEATGLGAWTAGCANRLPALADRVPNFIDTVTVVADADATGARYASDLHRKLLNRGLHAELLTLSERRAAA